MIFASGGGKLPGFRPETVADEPVYTFSDLVYTGNPFSTFRSLGW